MGWFQDLMDKRAAKGGKVVTWWRKTFGKLTPEDLERMRELGEKAVKKVRKK